MSMRVDDADLNKVIFLLSRDRLSKFIEQAGSEREGIELHQEALALNSSLFNIISTIEIALRNTVYQNLESYFGVSDWLLNPPSAFKCKENEEKHIKKAIKYAKDAASAKLTQDQKSKFVSNTSSITDKEIMTQINFVFWKRLYSSDYEHTLWKTTLKKTFPNKKIKRAHVADRIEKIHLARNRTAHHELVLYQRYTDTLKAIEFITGNLWAINYSKSTPLAKLIEDDLKNLKDKGVGLLIKLTSKRRD